MTKVALLLKSYDGDLEYAARLIESFAAHNPTGLTLYCIVPRSDVPLFTPLASPTVVVLDESPFEAYFTHEPVHGIRPGYINQEIVKLAFWELGLAENYFCIDSDAVFLRDISAADFIAPDGYPYTVLVEDNELKAEPRYYREHWQGREQMIRRIADEVGYIDPVVRTCHGHQVFSAQVLMAFKEEFLIPRGWSYLDALRVAPYEFTWYNLWMQAHPVIPIHPREPLAKVFHHEGQHLEFILRGLTLVDLARGYAVLVVNSNYSRDIDTRSLDGPKPEALSSHLSYREVAALLASKIRTTLRRPRA